MRLFIQVSKLYRLLESVSSLSDPTLEYLVKLDEDFEAWCSEVPACLKVQDGVRVTDDKTLILALRANMVRILINRQSLVPALTCPRGKIPQARQGVCESICCRRAGKYA